MQETLKLAESSALGWLVREPKLINDESLAIDASLFEDEHHLAIFNAVSLMLSKDEKVDQITLSAKLSGAATLEDVNSLSQDASGIDSAQFRAYLKILRDRAINTEAMNISRKINSLVGSKDVSTETMTEWINKEALRLSRKHQDVAKAESYSDVLVDFLEELKMRSESDSSITGVSTGFKGIDELTAGLQPADLVIVGGRPSMGKTTFAMNIAESIARGKGRPMVFSLEMPTKGLLQRSISATGKINQTALRNGKLSELELSLMDGVVKQIDAMDIVVDDTPALTLAQLSSRARVAHTQKKLDLIVIDYVQLMTGSGGSESRSNEIGEISRGIKQLAKELNIPIILLSQLNRSLENRPNKRPVNSDLRESGGLEQDADVIFFVYRDEVYDEESDSKGFAEIIIGKQRNGPLGTTLLRFKGQYCLFENASEEDSRRLLVE